MFKSVSFPLRHLANQLDFVGSDRDTVRITFSDGIATLRTDGAGVIREATLPTDPGAKGACLAPTKPLRTVLGGLRKPSVELKLSEDSRTLGITSGSFEASLRSRVASSETTLIITDLDRLDAANLRHGIRRVRHAIHEAHTFKSFKGVLLELEKRFRVVATDGYRLASYELDSVVGLGKKVSGVIPNEAIDEVLRFLDKTETCDVKIADGTLHLQATDTALRVGLKDAPTFDFDRALPSKFVLEFDIDAAEFLSALLRMSPFADERCHNSVDMLVEGYRTGTIKGDSLIMTAELREGRDGQARDYVEIVGTPDAKLELSCNVQFLIDAVDGLEGNVSVKLSGENAPLVITSPPDPAYRALISPLLKS